MLELIPVKSDTLAGALVSNMTFEGQGDARILHTLIKKNGEEGTITLSLPNTIQRGDLRKIADELSLYAQALEKQPS
ncbi:hypothetical protein [Pseudomonas serbica]|uniref:hypothetical protein n=1 Tax=Pseudomonas serbica TaxID=2965074 RepID=UPI00237BA231|nr:hypothetical protein [Pseudomonas serbica]